MFEQSMNILSSTDEPHRRQSVAPLVEGLVRSRDYLRMIRQPEIIIGAKIEHGSSVIRTHLAPLRGGDDPLALEQPAGFNVLQRFLQVRKKVSGHKKSYISVLSCAKRSNLAVNWSG